MDKKSMYQSMNEIIAGLWLGGIRSALDVAILREKNIDHIVSVCDCNPLLEEKPGSQPFPIGDFKQHFVEAFDDTDQDLITHFEDCFQFIQKGMESGGGVLVHCQMGVSRSATIVIGYLMRSQGLTLDSACKKVFSARPVVSPNPGFMAQLALFERMGRRIDAEHPHYRQYQLTRFVRSRRQEYGYYSAASTKLIPAREIPCLADPFVSSPSSRSVDEAVYRCRRCRRPLFRASGLLTHPTYQSKGRASDWRVRQVNSAALADPDGDGDDYFLDESASPSSAAAEEEEECRRELFVEPVEWMRSDAGSALQGKLACPKCSAKVGSFNWVGERCSCGQFVCPAFHLRTQAVDAPGDGVGIAVAIAEPPQADQY